MAGKVRDPSGARVEPAGVPRDADGVRGRRSARYRWVCLAVLCFAFVMAYFTRYATAVIVGDLRAAFRIDTDGIALLAAAYFYPYALMQPVAGLLADSLGPRRSIAAFLSIAVAGTVVFATAAGFPLALLGRVISGLGVATIYVGGTTFIARWFQPDEFGPVTGIFAAAGNVGGLTAAGPLAALIDAVGWRAAFLGSAAIMVVVIALVATLVRDRPAEAGHALDRAEPLQDTGVRGNGGPVGGARSSRAELQAGLRIVLKTPNTWLMGAYAFVMLGVLSSMQGLWTVPYLRDTYGLSRQAASNILSMWAIGLIVAMPFWGIVADRLTHRYRPVMLSCVALHALLWVLLIVRTSGLPAPLLYVLIVYGGFTNGCWVPAYAQLRASVPAAAVGTAMGLLNFAFFAGGAIFQQLSGVLLHALTPAGGHAGTDAYRAMFIFFLAALAVAFLAVAASREPATDAIA